MDDVEIVKSIQKVLETQAKLLNNLCKSNERFSEYEIGYMNRAFMSTMKACILLNTAFNADSEEG